MYKYLLMAIIISITLSTVSSAKNKNETLYWIDGGITVLGFVGDPHSLKLIPIRFTTYEQQTIKLFHKKSGWGLYAFYLPDLVVRVSGGKSIIMDDGYIIVKKRHIRSTAWKKKFSMKKKTINKKERTHEKRQYLRFQ